MTEAEVQAAVSGIWANALGVGDVAAQDDFFALGGDSILVTIVTLQVEEAVGAAVGADLVFDHPVLSDYSRMVAQAARGEKPTHDDD